MQCYVTATTVNNTGHYTVYLHSKINLNNITVQQFCYGKCSESKVRKYAFKLRVTGDAHWLLYIQYFVNIKCTLNTMLYVCIYKYLAMFL